MPRSALVLPIVIGAASLSACVHRDGKNTVAITMKDGGDTGNVSISVPSFDGKLRVPAGMIDHGDCDVDGVKLYPKSKITTFKLNVDGGVKRAEDRDRNVIRMGFAAPATVQSVTSWYETQLAAKSVHIARSAAGISGKATQGERFTVGLTPG